MRGGVYWKKEGDKKEGDKKEGDKKEGDKKEGDLWNLVEILFQSLTLLPPCPLSWQLWHDSCIPLFGMEIAWAGRGTVLAIANWMPQYGMDLAWELECGRLTFGMDIAGDA